jgi:hypothetical protein
MKKIYFLILFCAIFQPGLSETQNDLLNIIYTEKKQVYQTLSEKERKSIAILIYWKENRFQFPRDKSSAYYEELLSLAYEILLKKFNIELEVIDEYVVSDNNTNNTIDSDQEKLLFPFLKKTKEGENEKNEDYAINESIW